MNKSQQWGLLSSTRKRQSIQIKLDIGNNFIIFWLHLHLSPSCLVAHKASAILTDVPKVAYLAVVLRTYSSMLSISGLMVEIIVAKPAAYGRQKSKLCPASKTTSFCLKEYVNPQMESQVLNMNLCTDSLAFGGQMDSQVHASCQRSQFSGTGWLPHMLSFSTQYKICIVWLDYKKPRLTCM